MDLFESLIGSKIIPSDGGGEEIKAKIEQSTGRTYENITDAINDICDGWLSDQIALYSGEGSISGNRFKAKPMKILDIPSTIKTIWDNGFSDCQNLETVYFHEGLQVLNNYSCCSNPKLKEITIPSSVTRLGKYCLSWCGIKKISFSAVDAVTDGYPPFTGCTSLERIEITNTVSSVRSVFLSTGASNVSVYFYGTPTTIATNAFDTAISDIYVPWANGEVANAPWGANGATIHYNWTPNMQD